MIAVKSKQSKMSFCVLCFLMVGCILITGCGQPNGITDNNDKSSEKQDTDLNNDSSIDNNDANGSADESTDLEIGFDGAQANGLLSSRGHMACKSDKKEFNIDDVTFEIFYGENWSSVKLEMDCGEHYKNFDLRVRNNDGDVIVLKLMDEEFVSEKYICEVVYDEHWYITEVKYKHSEFITVPQEIFTKEEGVIEIYLWAAASYSTYDTIAYTNVTITSVYLNYKIVEGKVILTKASNYDMWKGS